MYSLSELNIYAQSNENETHYIDITLPLSSYSTLTFNIQNVDLNNIDYSDSLSNIGFDVLFENKNTQSYFEEVTISHRSEIQLDITTSGTGIAIITGTYKLNPRVTVIINLTITE